MNKLMKSLILGSLVAIPCQVSKANADIFSTIKGWFSSDPKPEAKPAENGKQQSAKAPVQDKKAENATQPLTAPTETKAQPSAPASTSKEDMIVFKDGTKIKRSDVMSELENSASQFKKRLNFDELVLYFSLKAAYEKVLKQEIEGSDLKSKAETKATIAKMQRSASTLALLNAKAKELMTFEELKKHYDEMWEKHIKDTKQLSLLVITVGNKKEYIDRLQKNGKTEEAIKTMVKSFQAAGDKAARVIPLDNYPETALPPEVSKAAKEKGVNSIVGPFAAQGVNTLFFVKKIEAAEKKDFTQDMAEQYGQAVKREFADRYVNTLIDKYKVTIFDLKGKKIDPKAKPDPNKKPEPVALAKIPATQVVAKINGAPDVTVQDLYNMFNVKSLENEMFGSLSLQLKISIEEVIQNAIKICVQEKLLSLEVQASGYDKTDKMKKIYQKIEEQHLRQAYFAQKVQVRESDVVSQYNTYISSIKPQDKNDQEISVRMMLFGTKEEAENALKTYRKTPTQFSEDFKKKQESKVGVIDLGFVKRQEADPVIWEVVRAASTGVCCPKVVEISGGDYGQNDLNYAVLYVGERRDIQLPSYQETALFFRKVAEKQKAVEIVQKLFEQEIETFDGKKFTQLPADLRNKVLIAIVTTDNEITQADM